MSHIEKDRSGSDGTLKVPENNLISDITDRTKDRITEILSVVSLESLIYKHLKLSNGHVISLDGTKYMLDSVQNETVRLLKKLDGSDKNILVKMSRKDFTGLLKDGKVNILNRQRGAEEKVFALDSAKRFS